MLKIVGLTINHEVLPCTTEVDCPVFGWKLESDRQGIRQSAYRIRIDHADGVFADTGRVTGVQTAEVCMPDLHLSSRTDYIVTVTVWDEKEECAVVSMPFSTGIGADEWAPAKWIRAAEDIVGWAPYLRKKFTLDAPDVKKATLYVSGLGCGEYYLNGQRIGDAYIDPPQTNYEREVLYRCFDVTSMLKTQNALTALLGEGFYAQSRVWSVEGFRYGPVCLIARLEILFADGTQQTVVTDESWKYKYSPITSNNLYAGETYDCRLETPDFSDADGSDAGWCACEADTVPKGALKGCHMPPVRIIRKVPTVSIRNMSGVNDGAWLFDFGENFAGMVEIHIPHSPRGAQYVLRFAETINDRGQLDFRSIGSFATQCIQQDIYIARGDEAGEVWHPRFTYHGFRYMELTGYHDLRKYGQDPELTFALGYALSTDLRQAGHFSCDYAPLDRFQALALRTFRSNYHGLPEDCPAREKCGWLGDAQIVCDFGIMNYDMQTAYLQYLSDLRTQTEVYGTWTMIAPGKRGCGEATPLWGCAQVLIPERLYRYYGNTQVIRDNWDLMEGWVEHERLASEDWLRTDGLGDWDPAGGNGHPRRMPVAHSSSMMFYEICTVMCRLASELPDQQKKAAYYADMAEKIKESIISHYYDKDAHSYGYWGSDGVALTLGLYPDGERQLLLRALVETIRAEDFEMHTGIYANKYLVPLLCREGYGDEAMEFLFGLRHPSFGTMMEDGATSVWEAPDMQGIDMDRTHGVASYNHPMHTGFAYAFYTELAGISPITPGFARFRIAPCRLERITALQASYESPFGQIAVSYQRSDNGEYRYTLTVPAGSVCEFTKIGESDPIVLQSGTYSF